MNLVCSLPGEFGDSIMGHQVSVFDSSSWSDGADDVEVFHRKIGIIAVQTAVGTDLYDVVEDSAEHGYVQCQWTGTLLPPANVSAMSRSTTHHSMAFTENNTLLVLSESQSQSMPKSLVVSTLNYCEPGFFKAGTECVPCGLWRDDTGDWFDFEDAPRQMWSNGGLHAQCHSCRAAVCVTGDYEIGNVALPISADIDDFILPGEQLWASVTFQTINGNAATLTTGTVSYDPTPPVMPNGAVDILSTPSYNDTSNTTSWDLVDVNFTGFDNAAAVSWTPCFDADSDVALVTACLHHADTDSELVCETVTEANLDDTPVWVFTETATDADIVIHNASYYFRVTCVNGAGLKTIAETDGFTVDVTPPIVTLANDGFDINGFDVDNSNIEDCLFIVFSAMDDLSSVTAYDIATFATEDDSQLTEWQRVTEGPLWTACELPLEATKSYYAKAS